MADTKSTKRTSTAATGKAFTDDEKAAMKERAREQKAAQAGADMEADCLAKIAEMTGSDRDMAERIHAIMKTVPALSAKTWYGMPAYAKDGKIVAFFQPAAKFKARYATIGFNEDARLDDGTMWPTSWALTEMTADDEKRIGELVKKAVS
jgi:uncharacterized protein YdhG (YjbR/CyaY superfamily)